jgi:hypothetical protein
VEPSRIYLRTHAPSERSLVEVLAGDPATHSVQVLAARREVLRELDSAIALDIE